jgi:hypothetical protein
MTTFFKNIKSSPFFRLAAKYFVWVVFILMLFLLTNLFSSLDLINAYGIPVLDILLTFGFLGFLFMLEALASAILLAAIQLLLERFLAANLSSVFTAIILFFLVLEWINLFLTEFNAAFI